MLLGTALRVYAPYWHLMNMRLRVMSSSYHPTELPFRELLACSARQLTRWRAGTRPASGSLIVANASVGCRDVEISCNGVELEAGKMGRECDSAGDRTLRCTECAACAALPRA
jgi:hypothetical protein